MHRFRDAHAVHSMLLFPTPYASQILRFFLLITILGGDYDPIQHRDSTIVVLSLGAMAYYCMYIFCIALALIGILFLASRSSRIADYSHTCICSMKKPCGHCSIDST